VTVDLVLINQNCKTNFDKSFKWRHLGFEGVHRSDNKPRLQFRALQ